MKRIFAFFTFLAFASPTAAAVLDFTDASIFGALDGTSSASVEVEGIGMTVTADPTPTATIIQSEKGLGVHYLDGFWGGRQIQGDEVLSIEFDDPQDVTGFTVTSLFNWLEGETVLQIEEGEFVINQGNADEFAGAFTATESDGTFAFDLTSISEASAITTLSFNAKGAWTNVFDSGFTLASITTNPDAMTAVLEPEPDAMLAVTAALESEPETMLDVSTVSEPSPDAMLAVTAVPEPGSFTMLGVTVVLVGSAVVLSGAAGACV